MHGLIHTQLQKFVIAHHGRQAWQGLLKEAGLGNKTFLTSKQYPDSDIGGLVTAACKATGARADALLEQFGAFLVPDLIAMYQPLLQPGWRTLDLLEHTESTIHSVVRMRNPEAQPARLRFRRVGPDEVQLTYDSARKLCAVARGIIRGVAEHFEETVAIVETACMHDGAATCEMSVRRVMSSEQPVPAALAPSRRQARPA